MSKLKVEIPENEPDRLVIREGGFSLLFADDDFGGVRINAVRLDRKALSAIIAWLKKKQASKREHDASEA